MKLLLLLFCLALELMAKDYSLRISFAEASKKDFGQILTLDTKPATPRAYTLGLEGGYLLQKDIREYPLDFYVKGGVNRFLEPTNCAECEDFYEATLYVKLYYGFLDKSLRVGLGEGGSYTFGHIANVERVEARENSDNNSNYLNYLEVSFDYDLGRLMGVKSLQELYLGYALKHRSGIYGLINNVRRGGSNYNMLTLEKNF